MSATTTTGTTIQPMAVRYALSACTPWRQLPEPAQTARGMMATMAAMTAAVFRKVSTWR